MFYKQMKHPPVTPGEILLEEFLKPLGITQQDFAAHLGWTTTKLNQIIRGKRAITPNTALMLEDALGMSADFWMNAQRACDLWLAYRTHEPAKRHPKSKAS